MPINYPITIKTLLVYQFGNQPITNKLLLIYAEIMNRSSTSEARFLHSS